MSEPARRPPNIVTIVLDCVRAKSVRFAGGSRVAATPVLDQLSRTGTVFTRAVSPSNWTVPSHMSMMTGAYPVRHQLRTFRKGEPRFETMGSWLARQGYETVLFSEQVHLVAGYGLESGYQTRFSSADRANTRTEDRSGARQLFAHSNALYTPTARKAIEAIPQLVLPINAMAYPQERAYKRRVCNDRMLRDFDGWIAGRSREKPFHAFINLVDGHEPYGPTDGWHDLGLTDRWFARTPRYYLLSVPGIQRVVPWTEFEGGYLRAIEDADRKVGHILHALDQSGERDRTYLILTSDHGQSFGERGHVFHGNGAVESVTRVPLLVTPPSGVSLPRRIENWTSLCAIPEWSKAAASGEVPFDEAGRPPFPHSDSMPGGDVVYCEGSPASDSNRSLRRVGLDQVWNHRLLAAYLPDAKLVLDIQSGVVHRWSLAGDLDAQEPEALVGPEAERLRERVFTPYLNSEDPAALAAVPADMDASVDERLRSWGYD